MSFPIGISAERRRAAPRARSSTVALTLMALLAGLLTVAGFDTVDPGGTVRVRTAPFVWGFVPERLAQVAPRPAIVLYAAALAVTVVGMFALLWIAGTIEVAPGDGARDEHAAHTSVGRASAAEADLAAIHGLAPACACAIAALALFAAWRMGLFGPWRVMGVADTFASFDNPFHVARAETLVRSLLDGHSLRWVANHQGGYPAEFYPFGWAWFEATLWFVGAGRVPMPIVHRVAVVALFVLPAVLFVVMARRDRWPPIVGLAAFALHVAMPGDMWGGGYSELVYVGLAPNVSSALCTVASMVAASIAFATGSRRAMAACAASAAAAIWCNPRSAIALVVCVATAWLMSLGHHTWRRATTQLAVVGGAAFLLAAPEIVSLARFGRLYFFIRYTGYASSLDYLAASIDVVGLPGFVLAGVGTLAAFRMTRERYVTRAAAAALVAYCAATLVLSFAADTAIAQLETTRLMPVQRLLTIYLAAVGLHVVASAAFARLRAPRWAAAAAQAVVVGALLVACVGPERFMPFWSRGLYPVDRSGSPAFGFLQQVLRVADRAAPPGTAILVAGTPTRDRPQLWAPVVSRRLFFYDDWMWYWQTRHRGPYDPARSSRYDLDRIGEVFDRRYLDRNAIGAVVAAPSVALRADAAPALHREFGGTYGLYLVKDPVPVVTLGTRAPDQLTVENERIAAAGLSSGGEALVRRNWFPRWRAEVNGTPAPIRQTDDGYMTVPVPAGRVRLELRYALDGIDVAARVLMGLGVAALIALARRGEPRW